MEKLQFPGLFVCFGLLAGCQHGPTGGGEFGDGDTGTASATETGTEGGPSSSGPSDDSSTGGFIFDVGSDLGGGGEVCTVPEDGESAPGKCDTQAPPDSFDAALEWEWDGIDGETYAIATPLVANLTDDDGSGQIDLCDVPDVVVLAFSPDAFDLNDATKIYNTVGHLYALDGASGTMHWQSEGTTSWWGQPALADIDGDGLVEIIAPKTLVGPLGAWNHDGTPVEGWDESYVENVPPEQASFMFAAAIAVADLDQDGTPEIVVGRLIYDSGGTYLGQLPWGGGAYATTTLVDLDQNGAMELVVGAAAYTYVGNGQVVEYYANMEVGQGHPHVADFDGDGGPEVLISSTDGLSLLDSSGTTLIANDKPVMDDGNEAWGRPAAIHDFDADDRVELSVSVGDLYLVLQLDDAGPTPTFALEGSWEVLDQSGLATGTAFDFLGDGSAEAMYGDENWIWVFDSANDQVPALVQQARSSRTLIEYPVVADVDNDGSAEVVVISNENIQSMDTSPTVQVFGDIEDRWIQARRIWNQHTYHVTNVREDGTIPTVEAPHWKTFNTFRTNAQIEGGATCIPEG